eukprot:6635056-Prymnesium_polylepis.1
MPDARVRPNYESRRRRTSGPVLSPEFTECSVYNLLDRTNARDSVARTYSPPAERAHVPWRTGHRPPTDRSPLPPAVNRVQYTPVQCTPATSGIVHDPCHVQAAANRDTLTPTLPPAQPLEVALPVGDDHLPLRDAFSGDGVHVTDE